MIRQKSALEEIQGAFPYNETIVKEQDSRLTVLFSVLALPIFPVRLQTSIFGASELNFRVRNGNGWTLTAINTNLLSCEQESKQRKLLTGSVSGRLWATNDYQLLADIPFPASLLFAREKMLSHPQNRTK